MDILEELKRCNLKPMANSIREILVLDKLGEINFKISRLNYSVSKDIGDYFKFPIITKSIKNSSVSIMINAKDVIEISYDPPAYGDGNHMITFVSKAKTGKRVSFLECSMAELIEKYGKGEKSDE